MPIPTESFPIVTHAYPQAAKNKVVLRFLDVRHSNLGYLLADFTTCDWEGWAGHASGANHDDTDYLYAPQVSKEVRLWQDQGRSSTSFLRARALSKAAERVEEKRRGRG